MPESGNAPIAVTGANGHIGRRLLLRLSQSGRVGRAVVRSKRAKATVLELPEAHRPDVRIVDYSDTDGLRTALAGCRSAVHLVGVIKETRDAPFEAAHERPCEALRDAAAGAGLERIVYLSVIGADVDSRNACLASRANAERILLEGPVPTTVIRVPMVLGPGDYATAALRAQATGSVAALIGGGSTLQQPIDARDVVAAIVAALDDHDLGDAVVELAGPECLSHRELVLRTAALHGKKPTILPIPLALMQAFAAIVSRLSPNPPITPAMLGVLQHDDRVDAEAAAKRLGIELTPLDETLRAYVGPESSNA